MSVIINIRGTSGSGKSTLARRIMENYPERVASTEAVGGKKRLRPTGYTLTGGPSGRPLFVLGHYEIPCGGADTIASREEKFRILREAASRGVDVLFEGLTDSDEVNRTVTLSPRPCVILLTTPIELCLERIRERRRAGGNDAPLNEENTRRRVEAIQRACARLEAAGVQVDRLDCDAAYTRAMELLR